MDRRHQRDGRSDYSKGLQTTCQKIFGFWTYYKQNVASGKTETITENRAMLEIRNNTFSGIMSETDSARVDEFLRFNPIADLKNGKDFEVKGFRYWATFTEPTK